jgi:hypothetical protein
MSLVWTDDISDILLKFFVYDGNGDVLLDGNGNPVFVWRSTLLEYVTDGSGARFVDGDGKAIF